MHSFFIDIDKAFVTTTQCNRTDYKESGRYSFFRKIKIYYYSLISRVYCIVFLLMDIFHVAMNKINNKKDQNYSFVWV